MKNSNHQPEDVSMDKVSLREYLHRSGLAIKRLYDSRGDLTPRMRGTRTPCCAKAWA
jgi:hypothetical protein